MPKQIPKPQFTFADLIYWNFVDYWLLGLRI